MKLLKVNLYLICSFVLFPLFTAGYAATIYVDNTTVGCSNGSTDYDPVEESCGSGSYKIYDHPQDAANVVNPGDIVIVKDGTYTESNGDEFVVLINRAGNSNNWIKFKSENRWGAVIDGQNSIDTLGGIVMGASAHYIVIENFEVKKTAGSGVGNNQEATSNIIFKGNHIHHIGRFRCTDSVYGIVGAGTRGSNITFDSNIIHDVGRLAEGENGCSPETTYWKNHDHGIYIHNGDNLSIINNIFYGTFGGWAVQLYDSHGSTLSNIDINNNTFADPSWKVGHIVLYNSLNDVRIYNNIFYNPTSAALRVNNTKTFTNVKVYNNLTSASSMADNNDTLIFSGNKLNSNPLFTDAANRYYTISSKESPAVDAGFAINIKYDADDNLRVGAPDIGAYEYTGSNQATCELAQGFEQKTLYEGMQYYSDRTYTLTSVPSQYIGLPVIKTQNDEWNFTDPAGYMTFQLAAKNKVYVAYDCRGISLPDWMNGFTDTGNTISTSFDNQPCLRVYEKDYTSGSCVDFGANKASGTSSASYSNYIVFYGQISDATLPSSPFNLRLAIN